MDEDEDQQGNSLSAAFPAPPPFYKHFTQENLSALAAHRAAAAQDELDAMHVDHTDNDDDHLLARLRDLPVELRYLIPPRPPASGEYHSFGDYYNISAPAPSLRSQNVEQLYTTPPSSPTDAGRQTFDHRAHTLTRLAKSILLNFLELVDVLAANPEEFQRKVDDLRTLFINAHHLINEYRPHQARETLIAMMEEQVRRKRSEVEEVRRMKERVDEMLAALSSDEGQRRQLDEVAAAVGVKGGELADKERGESQRVWDALDMIEV